MAKRCLSDTIASPGKCNIRKIQRAKNGHNIVPVESGNKSRLRFIKDSRAGRWRCAVSYDELFSNEINVFHNAVFVLLRTLQLYRRSNMETVASVMVIWPACCGKWRNQNQKELYCNSSCHIQNS